MAEQVNVTVTTTLIDENGNTRSVYTRSPDLSDEEVKRRFFQNNYFPPEMCKPCYIKFVDTLFKHLYKSTFSENVKIVKATYHETLTSFRNLFTLYKNTICGNLNVVYPGGDEYFVMFAEVMSRIVEQFKILQPTLLNFDVKVFYSDMIPFWNKCAARRWYFYNKHYE